jgi:ABC-type Fe3+-hydroxamate transport system substrate-binding protein
MPTDVLHAAAGQIASLLGCADEPGRSAIAAFLRAVEIRSVEGMLDAVLCAGEAAGLVRQAQSVVVALRDRLHRAQDVVNPFEAGPVVGCLTSLDPLMVPGQWVAQMIERAGGRHPLNPTTIRPGAGAAMGPQQGERRAGPARRVEPAELAASQPRLLVIAPAGLDLAQTESAVQQLAGLDWFESLPAVRHGRVALVGGGESLDIPGPGLVDGFEFLVGFVQERAALIPPMFPWRLMRRAAQTGS